MKPMTEWGIRVRKALVDRRMSVADLTRAINATSAQHIRDVMYGYRPGKKYIDKINQYLGLDA